MENKVRYIQLIYKNIKHVSSTHITKCIFYLGELNAQNINKYEIPIEKLKDDFINEIEDRVIPKIPVYEVFPK